jgi:hypothetical protein
MTENTVNSEDCGRSARVASNPFFASSSTNGVHEEKKITGASRGKRQRQPHERMSFLNGSRFTA